MKQLKKGFLINIEEATQVNTLYRKVLFTTPKSQLVLMCLKPGEEIGKEVHTLDQFIRTEEGEGTVVIEGEEFPFPEDWAIVIPAGTMHNVKNNSPVADLKLYSLYIHQSIKTALSMGRKETIAKNTLTA